MTPCLSRSSPWNSPGPPASLPPFCCGWARRAPELMRSSASVRSVIRVPLEWKWLARQILNVTRTRFLSFFLQEILEEVGDPLARLGRDLVLGTVVHSDPVLDAEKLVHGDRVVEGRPPRGLVLRSARDEKRPGRDEGVELVEVDLLFHHLL